MFSACAPELPPIPTEGRVVCQEKRECPDGYKCNQYLSQCVREGEDEEPPRLIEPDVRPPYVKIGTEITATFSVNEELATLPRVRVAGAEDAGANFSYVERDGLAYTYTLTVAGTEPRETLPVVVVLVDSYGNVAEDLILGQVTFDFSPPAVQDVRIADGYSAYLSQGIESRIAFTLSEAPEETPTAVFTDGTALTHVSGTDWDTGYEFSYVAQGPGIETEGPATVTVSAHDQAGNVSEPPPTELFIFDFTPPSVEPELSGGNTQHFVEFAGPLRDPEVTFTLTEPVLVAPVAWLVEPGSDALTTGACAAGCLPMVTRLAWDNQYTLFYPVPDDTQGVTVYDLHLRPLRDLAGNSAPDTPLVSAIATTITIDAEPPIFTGEPDWINATEGQTLPFNDGDRLEVTFELDEPVIIDAVRAVFVDLVYQQGADTVTERVTLQQTNFAGDSSVPYPWNSGPLVWALDIANGTHPEGSGTIKVQLVDRSGNLSEIRVLGPISIDYTGPTLSIDVAPNPAVRAAARDEIISIIVRSTEPLDDNGAQIDFALLTPAEQAARVSSSNVYYLWNHTVQPGEDGDYVFAATGQDLTGNPVASSSTATVRVDGTLPTIASMTTGGVTRFSRVAGYDLITLDVSVSELVTPGLGNHELAVIGLAAAPGDGLADLTCDDSGAPDYTCTFTLATWTTEPDGIKEVRFVGRDPAGNLASASLFVELDNRSPLAGVIVIPPSGFARLGESITITLNGDENLTGVSIDGVTGLGLSATTTGTSTTWTRLVDGTETNGPTFDYTINATDEVGNAIAPQTGSISIHASTPEVQSVGVTEPAAIGGLYYLSAGETFSVDIAVVDVVADPSDDIDPVASLVTLSGFALSSVDGVTWTGTVAGGENQGPRILQGVLVDQAGGRTSFDTSDSIAFPSGPTIAVFDFTPPVLSYGAVEPSLAGTGATIRLTLDFFESIQNLVVTTDDGAPSTTFFTQVPPFDPDNRNFVFTHLVAGAEAEVSHAVTVSADDLAGNSLTDASAGSVLLDLTPPELAAPPPVVSPNPVIDTDTFTVDFYVDAPLDVAPVLWIGNTPEPNCVLTAPLVPATHYVCAHDVNSLAGDLHGVHSLFIGLRDLAGNANDLAVGSIRYDFLSPVLDTSLVTPSLAGLGGTVRATFTFDETVRVAGAGAIVVAVVDLVGTPAAFTCTQDFQNGRSFVYSCPVPVASPPLDEAHEIRATVQDLIGNPIVTRTIGTFTIDRVAPDLSGSPSAGYGAIVVSPGALIVNAFSAPFWVDLFLDEAASGRPIMRVGSVTDDGGTGNGCVDQGGATHWRCTHSTADDLLPDGNYAIYIDVTDAAGNLASRHAYDVRYDFTPPGVVYRSVAPSLAGASATITASFGFDEEVQNVAVTTTVDALVFVQDAGNGFDFTWSYGLAGGEINAPYTVTVTAQDLAGQALPPVERTLGTFDIDSTPPGLLAGYILTPPDPILVNTADSFSLLFQLSEPTVAWPILWIGATPETAGCLEQAPNDGTTFLCTHAVADGPALEGGYSLYLEVRDAVGNVGNISLPEIVTYDLTAPSLTSFEVSPSALQAGVVTATFAFEDLVDPLTVEVLVDGAASTFAIDNTANPTITATYDATGDADATYTVSVRARDLAGNDLIGAPGSVAIGDYTIDTDPPGLVAADTVSPSPIGLGVVTATFSFDEPVDPASITAVLNSVPVANFAMLSNTGNTAFQFAAVLDGSQTSGGPFTVTVAASDLLGNAMAPAQLISTVNIDNDGPALNAAATNEVRVTPNPGSLRVANNGTVTIEFTINEVSAPAPDDPVASVGPTPASGGCTDQGDGMHFICTHTVNSGAENEGFHPVTVEATDLLGNEAQLYIDTVRYDFSPPTAMSVTLTRTPAYPPAAAVDPNRLYFTSSQGDPVTGGALTVTVEVIADEAIEAAAPMPVLVADGPDPSDFTFTLAGGCSDPAVAGNIATFSCVLGGQQDGDYDLTITWADDLGNANVAPVNLSPPWIAFDSANPGAVFIAADVTFTRAPWGDASSGAVPYFDVVGAANSAPANAEQVIAYRNAAAGVGDSIGRADTVGGGFAIYDMVTIDLPTVYLRAASRSGQLGNAFEVSQIEWIATMGNKTPGSTAQNPHSFETAAAMPAELDGPRFSEIDAAGVAALELPDAAVTATSGAGLWREVPAVATYPSPREAGALVFDSARGRVVFYGGEDGADCDGSGSVVCGRVWEWDGVQWSRPIQYDLEADGSPSARRLTAAAFDSLRGVTVLFGGCNASGCGSPLGDSWEWNGMSWSRTAGGGTAPTERREMAMGYDPIGGHTVVFGGVRDTDDVSYYSYTWDGTDWGQHEGDGVQARFGHAIAFDRNSGQLIAFGGCFDWNGGNCNAAGDLRNDTFIWDPVNHEWGDGAGTRNPVSFLTPPSARFGVAMAYDELSERIVLFGGCTDATCTTEAADTWVWDGTNWDERCEEIPATDICPPGPSGRSYHSMAFDPGRGTVILTGGTNNGDEVWGWSGAGWLRLGPPGDIPAPRAAPAMAPFVVDNPPGVLDDERLVMFGGCAEAGTTCNNRYNDTHIFDGASWRICPTAGGQPCNTRPSTRYRHAMAQAPGIEAVMFGGCTADDCGSLSDDLWIFDDTAIPAWRICVEGGGSPCNTRPTPVADAAMAYDAGAGLVVLFGGCRDYNNRVCQDADDYRQTTWTLDPAATPAWVSVTPATTTPDGRALHAMAYDPAPGQVDEDRVVMFGGCNTAGCAFQLDETWEWDGADWTRQCIDPCTRPSARIGAHLAYEPKRDALILVGGESSGVRLNDVWAWDRGNKSWYLLDANTTTGVQIAPRLRHQTGTLAARNDLVLFGGDDTNNVFGDLWVWDNRMATRPVHLMRTMFGAAGADANDTIDRLLVRWDAGASAGTGPTSGVALWAWYRGAWFLLRDDNSFTVAAPSSVPWDNTVDPPAVDVGELFTGADAYLTIAVTPKADNGAAAPLGEVVSDYASVTVFYTRMP